MRRCFESKVLFLGKCWRSIFDVGRCSVRHINGITDPAKIVNNFARYFEKVCQNNTVSGADRPKKEYKEMRTGSLRMVNR